MIKVRNLGRLGNNLFQFAFGYAASRELKTIFCMDDMGWFHLFKNRRYWQLKNKFLLKYWKQSPLNEVDLTNNEISPENCLGELRNHHSYRGYFQSVTYFIKYEKKLRKIFQFRKPFVRKMKEEFKSLLNHQKILVINIRGGDYQGLPFLLPQEYYLNAYHEVIRGGFEPDCLLIITDDRKYAERLLDFIPKKIFISNPSIEKDFFWLTQADAVIIPNSSFSWWGAWLNQRARIIIAPKYWLGWKEDKESPAGIMDIAWKWVEVTKSKSAQETVH